MGGGSDIDQSLSNVNLVLYHRHGDIYADFLFWIIVENKWTLNVRARVAIRPVYSKLVLPSQKSLEIIINIKIIYTKITNNKKIRKNKNKMGGVR